MKTLYGPVLASCLSLAASSNAGINRWTTTGPPGAIVSAFAIDPSSPSTIYAATPVLGVWKTRDAGGSWVLLSAPPASDTYTVIAVDPQTPSTVYAAAPFQLYRSGDAGGTWANLTPPLGVSLLTAFAIDPFNPRTLYLGKDSGDLLRSTDSGTTWTPFSRPAPDTSALAITQIAPDSSVPGTLYVSVYGGLFKSIDGGITWRSITGPLPSIGSIQLSIDPLDPQRLLAGTSLGVYASLDGGDNWARIGLEDHAILVTVFDPEQRQTIYAAGFGIFRSTDGGAGWTRIESGLPTNITEGFLIADPTQPGRLFFGTLGAGVYRTENRGETWSSAGKGLPADNAISEITVDPRNGLTVYSGGSLFFLSTDGGETWQGNTASLTPSGISALAIDPTEPLRLFAGTGAGVFRSDDGGDEWSAASNGITCSSILSLELDPALPSRLYVDTYHVGFNPAFACGGVFQSSNGGSSWSPPSTTGPIHERFFFDPVDPAVLYSVGGGVSKSTDGGSTWVAAQVGLGAVGERYFWAIAIDPAQRDILYLASSSGLFKSTDGAASWQASTGPLESASVRDVALDPANPSIIYGALESGFVFRSSDAGGTWTDFSEGLRDSGVSHIRSLRTSADAARIYVATDSGIFARIDLSRPRIEPRPAPGIPPVTGRGR